MKEGSVIGQGNAMGEIEEKAKVFDIKGAIATLIISSFGFVAALFWRDAIQKLIDEIVPKGEGLLYSFIAAVAVTIIAVIVIWLMTKYATVGVKLKSKLKQRIKPAHRKSEGIKSLGASLLSRK